MKVELKSLERVEVAYLRHVGPYGAQIGNFWIEQVAPWMQTNGLQNVGRYGISHDDPSVTDALKCRYDACVEVPQASFSQGTLSAPLYLADAMPFLSSRATRKRSEPRGHTSCGNWLPSSGLQMDLRPCFEHYPPQRSGEQSLRSFSCQICIPVVKL